MSREAGGVEAATIDLAGDAVALPDAVATDADHSAIAARLGWITLAFAIVYLLFLAAPALLGKGAFPLATDMRWQDVIDLATPLVLLPAYWFLVRQPGSSPALDGVAVVAFLLLGALWVEGQGMHLAANSIGNLIDDLTGDVPAAAAGGLIHLYDEVISHYLWHAATIGLVALALYRQWGYPLVGVRSDLRLPIVAGSMYGLTFFLTIVEGATGVLGVPAAAFLASFALLAGRGHLREQPVTTFVLVGHVVALVLFAGWFIYWGGLPEFSSEQVGWL